MRALNFCALPPPPSLVCFQVSSAVNFQRFYDDYSRRVRNYIRENLIFRHFLFKVALECVETWESFNTLLYFVRALYILFAATHLYLAIIQILRSPTFSRIMKIIQKTWDKNFRKVLRDSTVAGEKRVDPCSSFKLIAEFFHIFPGNNFIAVDLARKKKTLHLGTLLISELFFHRHLASFSRVKFADKTCDFIVAVSDNLPSKVSSPSVVPPRGEK